MKVGRLFFFLSGCLTVLLLSTNRSLANEFFRFSPIFVTFPKVLTTILSIISQIGIAIRFPLPSRYRLPSFWMKIVYSVCLCRMHSGHLTSAHDSHFHLFDCCYLRTLESSWRAQELPPSIFSKLMDSPWDQLRLLPFNISILLLVRRMRTSRRYSTPRVRASTLRMTMVSYRELKERRWAYLCLARMKRQILDAAYAWGQTFFC